jgi:dinuclear metal center YbgI/SA1388 family protein
MRIYSSPAKGNPVIGRQELLNYFQALLSPELFEDYAPNGLQIEGKERVKKVAFAVSATQDSLEQALAWGADALVVHHGVLWKHQGARTITGAWGERIRMSVLKELNLIAYHLPLDGHQEIGNAVALAQALGLMTIAPFGLYKKQPLGAQAKLAAPMKVSEFQTHLAHVLQHPVVLASNNTDALMTSVGIITGGANNDWIKALEAGLDAYITGEISEYNWHDAREAGLHYFAGGHHATEKFGPQALMARLKQDHPNLDVKFFDSANPA